MSDVLYLSRADVSAAVVDFGTGIELVRESLLEASAGRVHLPPKPGVYPRRAAFIHAMPAYAERRDVVGVKWIAGYPDNPAKGLPYIAGSIILSDADTGLTTVVMDAEEVTAVRTACVTGLTMQVLARATGIVSLIGCGRQGRTHLAMLASEFPDVAEVRVYDLIPEAARVASEEYADRLPIRVVDSVRDAAEGADVVMTAVAEQDEGDAGAIAPEWVAPGALALPLANDYGWTSEALVQCDSFWVDDIGQYRSFVDRGELTRCGDITVPRAFAKALESPTPARTSPDERICALNLGLGLHDIVLASAVERIARDRGIGTLLPR